MADMIASSASLTMFGSRMDFTSEDPEVELFGRKSTTDTAGANDLTRVLKTAPILTGDAFLASSPNTFPQRAVYGQIISQQCPGFPTKVESEKLYINTNAPFSAVVCGVQGSGKSHSTSVLLESCLIGDRRLGTLPEPLSAIVFHYDTTAGSGAAQPCEAAYVGTLDPQRGGNAVPPAVTVLVLPSMLKTMRKVYGALGAHIRVEALRFAPEDISGERLLSMMKVDSDGQMPLYMESIMDILRTMEDSFDYKRFRDELKLRSRDFNPTQKSMLNLRLTLLDSCLDGGNKSNRASSFFRRGHLVIVDLSSVFMDASTACGLFEIILGLFIEGRNDATGKLVVLDEAHKYLNSNLSSSRLTDSLLSVVRQQRHLGTRVVISTQEPTVVPPQFLDLCSFVVAHRFSSPTWLKHLEQHVSTVDSSWLSKVITLQTGEALIFAPSGVGLSIPDASSSLARASASYPDNHGANDKIASQNHRRQPSNTVVAPLGQGYLHVQSRLRVTLDGGMSILSTDETLRNRINGDVPFCPPTPASSIGDGAAAGLGDLRAGPSETHTPPTPALSAASASAALRPSTSSSPRAVDTPPTVTSIANPQAPVAVTTDAINARAVEELRQALLHLYQMGNATPRYSEVGEYRAKHSWTYTEKLAPLIWAASEANVVKLIGTEHVQLLNAGPPPPPSSQNAVIPNEQFAIAELKRGLIQLYRDVNRTPTFGQIDALRLRRSWAYKGDIANLAKKAEVNNVVKVVNGTVRLCIPTQYQSLMDSLSSEHSKTSQSFVDFSTLGGRLKGRYSGGLKKYIEGAAECGLVRMRGKSATLAVELAV